MGNSRGRLALKKLTRSVEERTLSARESERGRNDLCGRRFAKHFHVGCGKICEQLTVKRVNFCRSYTSSKMHIRAACSQSLHAPEFAYMKQRMPVARMSFTLLFVALVFAACARQSRQFSSQEASRQVLPQTPISAVKTQASGHININTAAVAELEKLPGIGPGIAERIVAYRQEHGLFRRAEHLMMVRGISERKFRAISSTLAVE